jgi:hypothetical protein
MLELQQARDGAGGTTRRNAQITEKTFQKISKINVRSNYNFFFAGVNRLTL